MTKLMRELIERLEALPDAEQDALAREFLSVLEGQVYVLTPEQEEEVRKALEDGEPNASPQEVDAFFARFRG
ncbi:UNVERIFIED_ORG: hypothetical protein ABID33_004003 [Xanthobacter viscosus]|uniref:Uncharacterized protein n=1 Tax=Xanthobacter autotrophicus TaxID=280 RepID=A0A6C1KJH4_XANAU|nr:hypothetical protein [Xanthobacter autotrophicus]TLX44429.1 hypothetical protein FBQ73_03435 [Xanthobacter autotrophicus]